MIPALEMDHTINLKMAVGQSCQPLYRLASGLTRNKTEASGLTRHQNRQPEVAFQPGQHDARANEPAAGGGTRALDARAILEALEGVDPTDREALQLFYLARLSYREIAQTLELPIDAVMSRLARGKDQLRAKLTPLACLARSMTPEPRDPIAPPNLS